MNENTQRLSQSFIERNDRAYLRDIVSHTPDAIREFADLTARLVELEEQPYLTIHRPVEQSLVRARIWFEQPRVRGRGCDGQPDRGSQEDRFVAEVYLRPFGERYGGINSPDTLLRALTERRVNTGEEQTLRTDGGYCQEVQMCRLSVNPQELPEMSPTARIFSDALQQGVPLGETEQRPAHMRFIRYDAGRGRVGTPAENGYVLMRQNDIYVVPTLGEFLMDENDRVTRALNVPERLCWFCDTDIVNLDEQLETTLLGQDLNGRMVFFVASTNRGDDSNDRLPNTIEMLERRGATIYATVDEAKGLL